LVVTVNVLWAVTNAVLELLEHSAQQKAELAVPLQAVVDAELAVVVSVSFGVQDLEALQVEKDAVRVLEMQQAANE
jgi:hypothetical protein